MELTHGPLVGYCFSNRHGSISSSSSITTACVSDFNRSGVGPGGGRFTGKSASRKTLPSKNNCSLLLLLLFCLLLDV